MRPQRLHQGSFFLARSSAIPIPIPYSSKSINFNRHTLHLPCFFSLSVSLAPRTPRNAQCLQRSFSLNFHRCPLCQEKLASSVEKNLRVSITLRDAILKLYPETASKRAPCSLGGLGAFESLRLTVSYPENNPLDTPVGTRDEAVGRLAAARLAALNEEAVRDAIRDGRRGGRGAFAALEQEAEVLDAATGRAERGEPADSLAGFKDAHLQAVLRRGGVLAEDPLVFEEMRGAIRSYLHGLIHDAAMHCLQRRAPVIQVSDVIAARPGGRVMLGFGGDCSVRYIWTKMLFRVLKQVHPTLGLDPASLSVLCDINTEVLRMVVESALASKSRTPAFTGPFVEDDDEEDDDRCRFFRTVSAGTENDDDDDAPAGFADNYTVRLYSEDEGEAFEALDEPASCISSREIQQAVRLLFPGELAKHAVSEGTKSVMKFQGSGRSLETWSTSSMGSRAGLQNAPEHAALVAGRIFRNCHLTVCAAVYLAAITEYITAEVEELGGNAAKGLSRNLISCHYIMLAIRNDEELDRLFARCLFRDASCIPHMTKFLLNRPGIVKEASAFDRRLVHLARQSQAVTAVTCYYVDPRTGHHRCARVMDEDDDMDCQAMSSPAPLLDALSLETAAQRREMARAALSDADRALMMAEGLGVWSEEDQLQAEAWGRPSMAVLHGRRLKEMREAQLTQQSGGRLLPLGALGRLCRELKFQMADVNPVAHFSAEALDCIAAYLENHLVQASEDAVIMATHDKRCAVMPQDLKAAKHLRRFDN